MSPIIKVVVAGATGETGRSIVKGLLESQHTKFEITAFTRESSLRNSTNEKLRSQGIKVIAVDLKGPTDKLVTLLTGIDVVVSAVNSSAFNDQILLANAAKHAGVKRFVPCTFATASPVGRIMELRDQKEEINNHIKKLYLPYTIIDVGWWFQFSFAKVPSGRLDYLSLFPQDSIPGDGETKSARTHLRDVGKYVARIIADPRTLNKMVFGYSEVLSTNEVYSLLEKASGEQIARNYVREACHFTSFEINPAKNP